MDKSQFQSFLPLTEVSAYILLSLASEPRHGYAIMKDVHFLSEERINLSAGLCMARSSACWNAAGLNALRMVKRMKRGIRESPIS